MSDSEEKRRELSELLGKARKLEAELAEEEGAGQWPPKGFYGGYYATSGFTLGAIAAAVSLLVNVIGAPIAGKSPLELIRVYLTFPLGEKALELTTQAADVYAIGDGVMLAIGCCLYLATGMVLGMPFYMLMVRFCEGKSVAWRFAVATVLSLITYGITFHLLLRWIQPALIGGNWITDPHILPPWVAIVTHLAFGWTIAVLYPFGRFQAYQVLTTPQD